VPERTPSAEEERRRWDRLAACTGDFSLARSTLFYRRCEQALIARAFGPLPGRRLLKLDLWNEAANTRILPWIADEGAICFALDTSLVVAARARANQRREGTPKVGLVCADIRHVPFADASFDLLYTMGTIEHVAEWRQALAEIARVLRPGGRAIVGVPNRWDPWLRPALVWLLQLLGCYPYAPERSFSARGLARAAAAAGLSVLGRSGILTLPGVVRMADVWLHLRGSRLTRLLAPLVVPFEALETRLAWAGRFGYLLALIVEKP
jgi:SAM-dependent methyltransferase